MYNFAPIRLQNGLICEAKNIYMIRTVAFFNEKGGSGKTTLTVLFASWLSYCVGEKVYVKDVDSPVFRLYNMRKKDKSLLNDDNRSFVRFVGRNEPYPVDRIPEKGQWTEAEYANLIRTIRMERQQGDGYMLFDFPGRFTTDSVMVRLALAGLLDLLVCPVDTDSQTQSSALLVNSMLKSPAFKKNSGLADGQDVMMMWNRQAGTERTGKRDWYGAFENKCKVMGIPFAKTKMRDIVIARRDADTFGFIRSTLCWPEQNIQRACPYIHDLFKEIKERLDMH